VGGGEGGGGVGGKGGGGGRGEKWTKPCMHIWIIKEKWKKIINRFNNQWFLQHLYDKVVNKAKKKKKEKEIE
jgi:hypothetical protein